MKKEDKYLEMLQESVEDFEKGKKTYKGPADAVVNHRGTSPLKTHEVQNNVVNILERFYFEEDELDEFSKQINESEEKIETPAAESVTTESDSNEAGLGAIFEMPMEEGEIEERSATVHPSPSAHNYEKSMGQPESVQLEDELQEGPKKGF